MKYAKIVYHGFTKLYILLSQDKLFTRIRHIIYRYLYTIQLFMVTGSIYSGVFFKRF